MAGEDLSRLAIEKPARAAGPRRGKKYVRWVAGFLMICLVAFLYARGVFSPAVEVEVATVSQVYPSQSFTLLTASGYVVAQRKAALASKATGRLVSLYVEEGSAVKKGEIVARLENDDVVAAQQQAAANLNTSRAALEQAKAELHDATLSFNRNKELVAKGFIAQTDFDTADARLKKAKAAVEGAEAAIRSNVAALKAAEVAVEYTLIRSPFDAVVLTKDADIGDIVTPLGAAANAKAAVVTIADMGSLQVEVDVAESNIENVRIGQPCEVQLDALPGVRFRAEVHMIVPTADRTKATVMVKVRFLDPDARILPEMSARVAFLKRPVRPDEQAPRTAVISGAITDRGGKKYVFLIRGDRAVETGVTVGERLNDMTEILGGAKAGDKVVTRPLEKLRNGSKIKPLEG